MLGYLLNGSSMYYSLVIPVFRANESLFEIYDRLNDVLDNFELILVFDCGRDESWFVIEQLVSKYNNVIGIKLGRNYGQHNATICGFSFAQGEVVITLDEDLQHDPKDIPALMKLYSEGEYDLVYGVYKEKAHSFFRNITSSILKRMLAIGIPDLNESYSSFRVLSAKTAKETVHMKNSYTFLDGYLTWITSNVGSVEIEHHESEAGESSYNIRKLIEHSVNIFVTFSNLPIRILTMFSFVFFLFGVLYSAYIIITAMLFEDYSAGFPTLVSILSLGFGAVLFGIGIIGEYIQKVNLKTTNRPNYTIKDIIQNK